MVAAAAHYHVHLTPASASWINQVEQWFADSPKSSHVAASIPQESNWTQISGLSSSVTMKIPSRIDGPHPQLKFSLPSIGSAKRPSRHHAANFHADD
jgi:hypothetical protein